MTPGKGRNSQKSDGVGEERYQIAISYAHSGSRPADLSYIEKTYKALKELDLRVFYSDSKEEQEKQLGKKLDGAYYDVFSQTEYILVFISWQYMQENEERKILNMEKRIAFSPLSLETGSVFPVVFDIEALPMNLRKYKYLFVKDYENPNPSELAKVIKKHYQKRGEDTPDKSFFSQGIFNYFHGYIEEAAKNFDEAIRLRPNFYLAYNARGSVKGKLGQYEEANKDFDKAIKLQPDFTEAYYNRGVAKGELGQHDEAVKDFDKAIRLRSDFAEAYFTRGVAKGELGQHDEAVKDFDKAIKLRSNYAEAYYNRGVAKAKLERHKEAVKDCDEAIKLRPNYAEAYFTRGSAKLLLGRYDEAVKDCDEAIKLRPNYAEAYLTRGIAKVLLGRHEEAIKDFDKAIELRPNYAEAYYHRSFANDKLGRREEAIKDLNKAKDLGLHNDEN